MSELKKKKPFVSGDDVRVWRMSRDMKQEELGAWLGISRTAVGEIEKHGGDKILALALAALDAGKYPVVVTDKDRKLLNQSGRKRIIRAEPSGFNPEAEDLGRSA
jgi:DNA-binding XRE family transcriptional regulator